MSVQAWLRGRNTQTERRGRRSLRGDLPKRVGATLAVVPVPTINGGWAAASRPPYGDYHALHLENGTEAVPYCEILPTCKKTAPGTGNGLFLP